MFFLSNVNDEYFQRRIECDMKEYLKDKNIDDLHSAKEYEKLKEIVLKYYDSILQYIIEEKSERDLIMFKDNIIRHDLDIESHVDFEKIKYSFYDRSTRGLSMFEKRAKTAILLNALEMINIYGIKQLNDNPQYVKKELHYKTFLYRKNGKSEIQIDEINKIGDMYGKDSIGYVKNIFILEKRVKSLLSYTTDSNEKEKLNDIMNRINRILNSLSPELKLVIQLEIATKKINDMFCEADGYSFESPSIDSIEKCRDDIQKNLDRISIKRPDSYDAKRHKEFLNIIDYYLQKINQLQNQAESNEYPKIENSSMQSELESVFKDYCQINRSMLIARLYDKVPHVIDKVDESKFMLVHFPPDESAMEETDDSKDSDGINLKNRIMRVLRAKVAEQKGRKYNRKTDKSTIRELYQKTRNPFNFKHRFPVKIQFLTYNSFLGHSFFDYIMCLTKPTSNISMTTVVPGKLKPHRNRKIGYGCLKSTVHPDAIYSIDKSFNLFNDENDFERDEYPISELDFGTQETMVDYTKIKPDYILVIKDTKDFENSEIYRKAREISEKEQLPLIIYDQYVIERKDDMEVTR